MQYVNVFYIRECSDEIVQSTDYWAPYTRKRFPAFLYCLLFSRESRIVLRNCNIIINRHLLQWAQTTVWYRGWIWEITENTLNLIVNIDLQPLFRGYWSEFGKCLLLILKLSGIIFSADYTAKTFCHLLTHLYAIHLRWWVIVFVLISDQKLDAFKLLCVAMVIAR